MSETNKQIELEIAHVLFIDIVGYSKLSINQQRAVVDELNEVVRASGQFQKAEAGGRLIKIPTGDGMALVFYTSPEAPAQCAIEISRTLKEHARLQLRMGVHSGPVSGVIDVTGKANVAGAGINMAQRVMDCGDAGHILLSKHVAEDLDEYEQWRPRLHDLGACEVKHGVRVGVVNLYADEVGNPQLPKKFQALKKHSARMRRLATAGALLTLAAIVGGIVMFSRYRVRSTLAAPEKSVAVLPFENLSHDPDNAYFADGIQEEILSRLSKIADLKVISRTSTQRYRSKPDNLLEIAKQLGVAHVLEGTIQKAADQVRVNVQLINAQTDSHLWADKYDRRLTDIFGVESEIATKIADTLQAKLTGSEKQAIGAHPTENSEAHQLYLRGRYFWGKRTADGFKNALNYFQQAIAKDPNYALAYTGMADCYTLLANWGLASPEEYYPKAKEVATKALQIDNSLGEAHASLAEIFANELNLREAKREAERAIELAPNYATAHHWFGIDVLSPLGQHDRAITELRRAVELDPFSAIINTSLGLSYIAARRYPEAVAQLRRTVELDPEFPYARQILGDALALSGQLDQAISEYEKAHNISHTHYSVMRAAHAYALKGEREKALQLFNQAKELSKPAVWAYGCALIYIGLGNKEEAINWLEQSYLQKESVDISLIKVHPFLDPLRGDPRFEKLANQVVPPM
jgi:TolB-like protein/Tfp pilus assembly protein PilF